MEIDLTTPRLAVFGHIADYAGLYQPFLVLCPTGAHLEGTVHGEPVFGEGGADCQPEEAALPTRAMQVAGIGSLLLCVVSMFFVYIRLHLLSAYIFGLALILLIISLAISVYEIYISVKSLEIHLNDMHE